MSEIIRLALIGAGPWGRRCLETLPTLEGATLVRIASRNPETRRLTGGACRVDADWREAVSAKDVDGVIIATPPALHAEMTRAALEAGRAVFVEKPLTLDAAQARGLLELAERLGGRVLVDHIHLFNPGYLALKRRAASLGEPRAIRSRGGNRGPWRADTPPLWDYGPHDVALCLDFLRRAPEFVAASREEPDEAPGERGEILRLRLDFTGPVSADIRVGNALPDRERRFEAIFPGRALVFDDVAGRLTLHALDARSRPAGTGEALPFDPERPLSRALKAFVEVIRSGTRDLSSLRLGVAVVETLEKAQAQVRSDSNFFGEPA